MRPRRRLKGMAQRNPNAAPDESDHDGNCRIRCRNRRYRKAIYQVPCDLVEGRLLEGRVRKTRTGNQEDIRQWMIPKFVPMVDAVDPIPQATRISRG